jgi:hypothetical protein
MRTHSSEIVQQKKCYFLPGATKVAGEKMMSYSG